MPNLFSRAGSAVALTALAALALSGCSHDDNPPNTTVVSTTPPSTPPVMATPPGAPGAPGTPGNPASKVDVNAGPGASTGTDTATAKSVNDAIVTNKQMTGSRIEAVVTDGVCTLTGITQNKAQKGIAEQTASRVAGVTKVKNKIEIRPTGGAGKTPPPTPKVIVVHDKAAATPASPQSPAPPATPATPKSSGDHMNGAMKGHDTMKGKPKSDTMGKPGDGSTMDNSSGTTTTDTTTTTTTGKGQ